MSTTGDSDAGAATAHQRGISKFHQVFAREVEAISERRKTHGRARIALEDENHERDGTPVKRPKAPANVIGLALSGGGIRSAAFGLGALQALDAQGLMGKIDYLSTVSGGGYIGTSMTAAMSRGTTGAFPFTSDLQTEEAAGVQHIRDHSNYLFPQGLINIFANVVVYLRGLVANVMLLLPVLLLLAALTIVVNPTKESLTDPWFARYVPTLTSYFGLTLDALLVFLGLLAAWALWRSTRLGRNNSDVRCTARFFGASAAGVVIVAFCELQPLLLLGMFDLANGGASAVNTATTAWIKTLAATLAPLGAIVGFLSGILANALKRVKEKPSLTANAMRIAIKLAMYLAGATVPLVLWVVYLYLAFWGMPDAKPWTPSWLSGLAASMHIWPGGILGLYLLVGLVALVISWFVLSANANSLHRLYRDRLSKAFLFDPTQRAGDGVCRPGTPGPETDPQRRTQDLAPLDTLPVSKLAPELAPYHLINAALNIEGSKFANRRGRNADFFFFSPLFTGSEATGYVDTAQMEAKSAGLNAGAAMAISGAAASSNMGSETIKPLVPTLAILNIRLGYWLSNPAKVAGALRKAWLGRFFDKFYFLKELFGLLTENSATVYLTDGGHIENLGLYELLRRRCKLIIAIDAEADPDLSFGSLMTLERYARIDFGLRIGLPWQAVRDKTKAVSAELLENGGLEHDDTHNGPHCALGTIYYPRKDGDAHDPDSTGVLLYVKSSFTGDENDYVIDYKRRNPDFPHETTLDQLFTEEQFEAYRNLGFHAVNSALKDKDSDVVAMDPYPAPFEGAATTLPLERQMREILGLPVQEVPAGESDC